MGEQYETPTTLTYTSRTHAHARARARCIFINHHNKGNNYFSKNVFLVLTD